MPNVPVPADLLARAHRLMERTGTRSVLGVTGPPGAGKSTLAEGLVAALGPGAVLVPMDGFHLAQVELRRLGRQDRKGAPDTFDAAGYAELLSRAKHSTGETVYAPMFRRDIEEPVAGAVPVLPGASLVVTEGNYLLDGEPPWDRVRSQLDEVWYVEVDDSLRRSRLVARHMAFGRAEAEAVAWAGTVDEPNALRVAATRHLADVVVSWN